jgi:Flp pilus assembly protein TadG
MTRKQPRAARRGTTLVESAFVLPLAFFLVLALAVGGMGIFRYQEVATLARDGARYGSTHGYQYRKDAGLATGTSTGWSTDIYNNGILPNAVALDTSNLSYSVTWPDVINQPGKSDNWPGSQLTVTVSYNWFPELYLVGPIVLTSTSSMPITT